MYPFIIKSDYILNLISIIMDIPADGITIWPFIVVSGEGYEDAELINHERIHLAQQKELFVIFFYVLYIAFWAYYRMKGYNQTEAYMSNPFEIEAYNNESDYSYRLNRQPYAWLFNQNH